MSDVTNKLRSADVLLRALGYDPEAVSTYAHLRCPFHEDSVGSLSIWQDQADGWRWTCHAGCGSGSYLHALQKRGKMTSEELISGEFLAATLLPGLRPERVIPVPNKGLLSKLFSARPLSPEWKRHLAQSRRISGVTADFYNLRTDGIYWFIPIFSPCKDEVCAVKNHVAISGVTPKSKWWKIGTYPKDKPRHGISTLYPRPENWNPALRLFILPGELKALRMISLGHQAVSPTSGESFSWPEVELKRLRGFRCTVIYDDDPAGHRFRDKTMQRLRFGGIPCKSITAGEKKKG